MNRQFARSGLSLIVLALSSASAFAHHVMGGRTPATFGEGILSGFGLGLDHLAAVAAVGCLAAAHRAASPLVVAFVLPTMADVALHLRGATVPGAEILVALTVIAPGALMLRHRQTSAGAALVLFAMLGVIHGYALGESIYRAESALGLSA
jgi:urease accessory protein